MFEKIAKKYIFSFRGARLKSLESIGVRAGGGLYSPSESGKKIFWAIAKFFGSSQQP